MVAEVPWTLLACLAYSGNVCIGTASLRGRSVPRSWHGRVFLVALALTAIAAATSFPEHGARGAALIVALVPLLTLPFVGRPVRRRPSTHIIIGLVAAPCFAIALLLWAVAAF
ncbi:MULTISPECIES: hypothetical protein [Microbacteriaceae]|uniref:hypothetical protein n=1 Tax=Microbacteriaceae TaxID=85023 RepID=UPI001908A6F2|nr:MULTISPECIES: hypothetical protein [Microbacteriaceae]